MIRRRSILSQTIALTALTALWLAAPVANAQDSDGDGAADGLDSFPCDSSASAEAFVPARGVHGMILAEDQWPAPSDDDFNDFVGTYNYVFKLDGTGNVVSMQLTLNALALGGRFDNGLGLQLPVARGSALRITRQVGTGPATTLSASTTDANLTVVISSNLRELFGGRADQINSVPGGGAVTGEAMVVHVDFSPAVSLSVSAAPYDLFLFRSDDPTHEIHRTPYSGTSKMDQTLFGSQLDGSSVGRYFVDNAGQPSILLVPDQTPYPTEATSITSLFPNIANFASSGGTQDQDFYSSQVVTSASFAEAGRPAPIFVTADRFAADSSCLPTQSCQDILTSGQSTGDGLYWIDPDGSSNPLAPVQVTCDMTTSGGGWMRLDMTLVRDNLVHQFIDYRDNCSFAQWSGDLAHFGEQGACNSSTDVALAITIPFGYREFRLDNFGYIDGPSSGSWDVGTADLTTYPWTQTTSDSVGDIAFGSRQLATPTTSYTSTGQPRTTSCNGCTLPFPGNGVVYDLGQTVTDFTIRLREGGGQVEDVYIGGAGHIWIR